MSFHFPFKSLFILLTILTTTTTDQNTSNKLLFVFTMFRHGARSPFLSKDSTDIFGEQWQSSSQLTDIGIRQQYLLGKYNRIRYNSFLSPEYSPSEVVAFSTQWNRTLHSGNAHLQGLYPNIQSTKMSQERINKAIPPLSSITDLTEAITDLNDYPLPNGLQLIPVTVTPVINLIRFYQTCPNSLNVLSKNEKHETIVNAINTFNTKYGDKLLSLLNITDKKYFSKYKNVVSLCDTFMAGYTDGRAFNSLKSSDQSLQIDLAELNATAFDIMQLDNNVYFSGDHELNKAFSGGVLQTILNYISRRVNNDKQGNYAYSDTDPKMVVFSVHDYDLSSLFMLIKEIFEVDLGTFYMSYASMLSFEVRYKGNDVYVVDLLRNGELLMQKEFDVFEKVINTKLFSDTEYNVFCHGVKNVNVVEHAIVYSGVMGWSVSTWIAIVLGVVVLGESFIIYRNYKREKYVKKEETFFD